MLNYALIYSLLYILIALQTSGQPQHGYPPPTYAQPNLYPQPHLPCPTQTPCQPPNSTPYPVPYPVPCDPCLPYPKPLPPCQPTSYYTPHTCSPQYQISPYGIPFPVFCNYQDCNKKPLRNGDNDENEPSPDANKKRKKQDQDDKQPPNPDNDSLDNNYDPDPTRSGRPRVYSTLVSRLTPGRTSGLLSNIGATAGSFADSIFK